MRKFLLPILMSIFGILLLTRLYTRRSYETFGTSPGTMDQLQTSHVPTAEDAYFYSRVYPKIVRREITDLTGDDPGELRPWIFPWYGRGVTMIA